MIFLLSACDPAAKAELIQGQTATNPLRNEALNLSKALKFISLKTNLTDVKSDSEYNFQAVYKFPNTNPATRVWTDRFDNQDTMDHIRPFPL